MQCTVDVALAGEKQKNKTFLLFRYSEKFSEIFVEGISTLDGLLSFLTANLPLSLWSFKDILR